MKKRLVALIVTVLLLGAQSAQAQEHPWLVYLYNGSARELLRVNADGTVTDLWSFASPDPSISWELAWAAPTTTTSGLQPFPAVP
jgi:hypothetical protein